MNFAFEHLRGVRFALELFASPAPTMIVRWHYKVFFSWHSETSAEGFALCFMVAWALGGGVGGRLGLLGETELDGRFCTRRWLKCQASALLSALLISFQNKGLRI